MIDVCNLYYEHYGECDNKVLIILHGFFASSRNWQKIAMILANDYSVYVVDMRNHGKSNHHNKMNYPAMTRDILYFIEQKKLSNVSLLGHSMGGKVAMYLALLNPNSIDNLIVADISPVSYQHSFDKIINTLKTLPLNLLKNRKQASDLLAEEIPELIFRQFLLQNLVIKNNYYQWRINLDIFLSAADNIIAFPKMNLVSAYKERVLFLKAENSDYVKESEVKSLFPKADIKIIRGTGHWLHAEQPETFCKAVQHWLH